MKNTRSEEQKFKTKTFLNDETYKRKESLYSLQHKIRSEFTFWLFIQNVSLSLSLYFSHSGTDHEHFSDEILLYYVVYFFYLFFFYILPLWLRSVSMHVIFWSAVFSSLEHVCSWKIKPVFRVLTNGQIPVYSYEAKKCYGISIQCGYLFFRFRLCVAWVMPVVKKCVTKPVD